MVNHRKLGSKDGHTRIEDTRFNEMYQSVGRRTQTARNAPTTDPAKEGFSYATGKLSDRTWGLKRAQ
jgi:hypothetical protein